MYKTKNSDWNYKFNFHKLNRKNALLSVNIVVLIGTVLGVISKYIWSYETIMVNRFLAGVVCGLFSGIFPMYLNECSPKNLRGRIGVINQLSIVLGIFFVNIFGLKDVLGTSDLWPVIFGLSLVPTLIHGGLFFAVESPKYTFTKVLYLGLSLNLFIG